MQVTQATASGCEIAERTRSIFWIEPDVVANVTYSELMLGRLRDSVLRDVRIISTGEHKESRLVAHDKDVPLARRGVFDPEHVTGTEPSRLTIRRGDLSAVWPVLVEAVLAVEEDAPALTPVEPAQSCDAPSPQRSAATLGPSFNHLIRPQHQ